MILSCMYVHDSYVRTYVRYMTRTYVRMYMTRTYGHLFELASKLFEQFLCKENRQA